MQPTPYLLLAVLSGCSFLTHGLDDDRLGGADDAAVITDGARHIAQTDSGAVVAVDGGSRATDASRPDASASIDGGQDSGPDSGPPMTGEAACDALWTALAPWGAEECRTHCPWERWPDNVCEPMEVDDCIRALLYAADLENCSELEYRLNSGSVCHSSSCAP